MNSIEHELAYRALEHLYCAEQYRAMLKAGIEECANSGRPSYYWTNSAKAQDLEGSLLTEMRLSKMYSLAHLMLTTDPVALASVAQTARENVRARFT